MTAGKQEHYTLIARRSHNYGTALCFHGVRVPPRVVMLIVAGCLLLPASNARARGQDPPNAVLGRAGEIFIPEWEFLQRYELFPSLRQQRRGRMEHAKTELMVSLLAEKLLVQEARARGLDRDSAFVQDFDGVRKLLARDQLYREEVSGRVSVQEEEIVRGMVQAKTERLVEFLFFPRGIDAEHVRRQILDAGDFEKIVPDSTFNALRDTATVIWGDAAPLLEQAAYALAPGELSDVLPVADGFYLIQVKRIGRSNYFNSLTPSALREYVVGIIRGRKERARLQEFTESFLRGKPGFARGPVLQTVTEALHAALRQETGQGPLFLSERVYHEASMSLHSYLQDTIAVAGDRVWSVHEVLKRLYARSMQFSDSRIQTVFRAINNVLREWVQQELLAQEGLRRKLDQYPSVRRQLDIWLHASLAYSMKEHVNKSVMVTEAEVWAYMSSTDTAVNVPLVQVREVRTVDIESMERAIDELQEGEDFAVVAGRWSADSLLRQTGGLTPRFRVTERSPIGALALTMAVGERYGPIRTTEGFLLFELVSMDTLPNPGNAVSPLIPEQAKADLLRMKQRRTLDLFLAQVGEQRGFDYFDDRLARIRVTDTPMTTFRLLGFGGRMFAVPFVDPLIDWINIDPPSTTIVP